VSGQVAIVTGGLRGLGRAMAVGLAAAGHRVLAVGHLTEDLPALDAELAAGRPAALTA
jgi:NAD(P)-dependent dehydrogenase (short-subunit alcohol dehydrogenase family)